MHLKNQAQQNVLLRPAKPPLLIQQKLNLQQQHPSSILKMNNAIGVLMVQTLKITIRATDDGWQQRVNHREKHVYRLAVITASAMLQFTILTLVSVSSRALTALTTCTGRTKSKHLAAPSILHLFAMHLKNQAQQNVLLRPAKPPLLIQQKLNLQQQHPSSILKMNNAIGVLMVQTLKITIRATDDG